jgi:hypothetical protein
MKLSFHEINKVKMDDTNTQTLGTKREQLIKRLYGTVPTKSQLLHHQLEVCYYSFSFFFFPSAV